MHRISSIFLIMVLSLSLILGAAGCSSQSAVTSSTDKSSAETRTMVDSAGRSVTMPVKIDKVYCTTPVGTTNIYMLAPEKLVGWNYALSDTTKKFIPAPYCDLPNLGMWYMDKTANVEELLKLDPDLIIASAPTDPAMVDEIATKTGKPVFYIKYPVWESGAYFEKLGEILNAEEQALKLTDYCDKTVTEVEAKSKTIPSDQQVTVYYAEGTDGLMTDPRGSVFSEALDYAGGLNVAEVPTKSGAGMTPVTLEQILVWDPDVIVTWTVMDEKRGFLLNQLLASPDWQALKAIKEKRIYEAPNEMPFSFFGRLPAANQIIGLVWAAELLYPDVYNFDVRKEIKDFYKLAYHLDLTDAQLDQILEFADQRHLQ